MKLWTLPPPHVFKSGSTLPELRAVAHALDKIVHPSPRRIRPVCPRRARVPYHDVHRCAAPCGSRRWGPATATTTLAYHSSRLPMTERYDDGTLLSFIADNGKIVGLSRHANCFYAALITVSEL